MDKAQGVAVFARNDLGESLLISPAQISYTKAITVGREVEPNFERASGLLNEIIDLPELGLDRDIPRVVFQFEATVQGSSPDTFLNSVGAKEMSEFYGGGFRFFLRGETGEEELRAETLVSDPSRTFVMVQIQRTVGDIISIEPAANEILEKFNGEYIPFATSHFCS